MDGAQHARGGRRHVQGGGRVARQAAVGRYQEGRRRAGLLHERHVDRAHRRGGARPRQGRRPGSTRATAGAATEPDTPLKLFAQSRASHLLALAQNDDKQKPEIKDQIKAAADAAHRPATVEVYHADHGWTVADSPVYNKDEADRAWSNLLALYSKAL